MTMILSEASIIIRTFWHAGKTCSAYASNYTKLFIALENPSKMIATGKSVEYSGKGVSATWSHGLRLETTLQCA